MYSGSGFALLIALQDHVLRKLVFRYVWFGSRGLLCALWSHTLARPYLLCFTSPSSVTSFHMAPHLTPAEQDIMLKAHAMKKTPAEIFEKLGALRQSKDIERVNITVVLRFLNGKTYKRGIAETRGRKRTYSRRNVLTMNAVRRAFIKKTKGTQQVKWSCIRRQARALGGAQHDGGEGVFSRRVPSHASAKPREAPTHESRRERAGRTVWQDATLASGAVYRWYRHDH